MEFEIHLDKMYPHQRKWWELENFIPMLVGGYGCGKTYIGGLKGIWLSHVNAPIPGQYVSPTYKIARKTIVLTLQEILDRSGITYSFNQERWEFKIENWGGVIWIGSGEDPDSLKGPNLAWAGIDEPFIQKRDVFKQLDFRVRHPDAKHRELFITGTWEGDMSSWGYDLIANPDGEFDVGVVQGRTGDNLSLDPTRIEQMKAGLSEEEIKVYFEGAVLSLMAGRVYKAFDAQKHIIPRPEKEPQGMIIAGIDFNVDYMSAELAYKGPTWLHWFDEIRLANATTYDLAEALKAKAPGCRVYPDPTGSARKSSAVSSDHEILRQAGFNIFARGQVPVRDRVNAVNRIFRMDNMTIEPGTCPHLVRDFDRNVWKLGDIDKRSDLSLTHSGDAGGYAVEYLFPVKSREVRYFPR